MLHNALTCTAARVSRTALQLRNAGPTEPDAGVLAQPGSLRIIDDQLHDPWHADFLTGLARGEDLGSTHPAMHGYRLLAGQQGRRRPSFLGIDAWCSGRRLSLELRPRA